jgi:hypothetical protein
LIQNACTARVGKSAARSRRFETNQVLIRVADPTGGRITRQDCARSLRVVQGGKPVAARKRMVNKGRVQLADNRFLRGVNDA